MKNQTIATIMGLIKEHENTSQKEWVQKPGGEINARIDLKKHVSETLVKEGLIVVVIEKGLESDFPALVFKEGEVPSPMVESNGKNNNGGLGIYSTCWGFSKPALGKSVLGEIIMWPSWATSINGVQKA